MDRYKGTAYESPPEPSLFAPTGERPIQRQLLLLASGLIVLLVGVLVAKLPGFSDQPVPNELFFLVPILVPLIAGTLSKVVPGQKARGPFKGWLLGYVGWWVGATVVVLLGNFTIPTLPVNLGFVADQVIEAVAGTALLRGILLPFD